MTSPLEHERDALRESFVRLGFSDDGELLRGSIRWTHPGTADVAARVEVLVPDEYPFVPPKVRVRDVGAPMPLTFHVERPEGGEATGWLCLWEGAHDVARAPWRDAAAVVERVAGHLEMTAAGWPDDTACDLERYLPREAGLVLYDQQRLATVDRQRVRVRREATLDVVTISDDVRSWSPASRRRAGRRDHHLAYVEDVGELSAPITCWADLVPLLGDRASRVKLDVSFGRVSWIILRYRRSGQPSVLALRARPVPRGVGLHAVESADTSEQTRQLRAGPRRDALTDTRVAIVGLGAVGSFTADILFRTGVRQLTLIDFEILRPGNVVRHLLGDGDIGVLKADGVAATLGARGASTPRVRARYARIDSIGKAAGVIRAHDLVIDATGDALATGLLSAGTETGAATWRPQVLSACVQRQGEIIRVDALPARPGEPHLPALARRESDQLAREQGCGSPVSLTPPGSVIASAELVSRLAIELLTDPESDIPSSVVTVFAPQPETPYATTGTVTSRPPTSPAMRTPTPSGAP